MVIRVALRYVFRVRGEVRVYEAHARARVFERDSHASFVPDDVPQTARHRVQFDVAYHRRQFASHKHVHLDPVARFQGHAREMYELVLAPERGQHTCHEPLKHRGFLNTHHQNVTPRSVVAGKRR